VDHQARLRQLGSDVARGLRGAEAVVLGRDDEHRHREPREIHARRVAGLLNDGQQAGQRIGTAGCASAVSVVQGICPHMQALGVMS
jgi:hypothetical protein